MNDKKNSLQQNLHPWRKLPYQKPVLAELGDLRTMTLSPTPDDFEESGPAFYRRETQVDFTTDQFEGKTSRKTDSSGGGRSGRG